MLKARPSRHDGMRVNVSHSTATLDVAVAAHSPMAQRV